MAWLCAGGCYLLGLLFTVGLTQNIAGPLIYGGAEGQGGRALRCAVYLLALLAWPLTLALYGCVLIYALARGPGERAPGALPRTTTVQTAGARVQFTLLPAACGRAPRARLAIAASGMPFAVAGLGAGLACGLSVEVLLPASRGRAPFDARGVAARG